jgi:hypothetical protein
VWLATRHWPGVRSALVAPDLVDFVVKHCVAAVELSRSLRDL